MRRKLAPIEHTYKDPRKCHHREYIGKGNQVLGDRYPAQRSETATAQDYPSDRCGKDVKDQVEQVQDDDDPKRCCPQSIYNIRV